MHPLSSHYTTDGTGRYDEPMKEPVVKLLLVVIALSSLFVGGAFLVIPGWIISYTGITATDPAWLRSIGAATLGLQGFGLLVAAFRRRDTTPLLGIVAFVTTLEMGVIWYSLFSGGYGEMNRLAIVAIAILTTVCAGLLWIVWSSRRKSLQGGDRSIEAPPSEGPVSGGTETADLVEEIDSQSPRFTE